MGHQYPLCVKGLETYDNIKKIAIGFQGDYYITACLLDYINFNKYYKMIAIYLSKEQALHVDREAIQQINFTGNLIRERNGNTTRFLIIEKAKKAVI